MDKVSLKGSTEESIIQMFHSPTLTPRVDV